VTPLGLRNVMCTATCAAVLGCAAPNMVVYSAVNAPPRAFVRRTPASVDVFVGRPPVRPCVDVGLFEVAQGSDDDGTGHSTEDMLATLRLHAALRGCDALQVLGVESAHVVGSGRSRVTYRSVVQGVCEMYTDPQAIEADKSLKTERLPGEGQSCGMIPSVSNAPGGLGARSEPVLGPSNPPAPGSSNAPPPGSSDEAGDCRYPLVCSANVCASPYR
jgi:hypothetical protein